MNESTPPPRELAERILVAAEEAGARPLVFAMALANPILLTIFFVVDDAELGSGSVGRTINGVGWLAIAAGAVWVIRPWRPIGERPVPIRVWIYGLWGWLFGALLAITYPAFELTSSTTTDSRALAGQFWHEVARSVPLLDLPRVLGWRAPLEQHSIGVGVVFVAARVATLLFVGTVVRIEWQRYRSGSSMSS